MERLRQVQNRLQCAATLPASFWVAALALLVGALAARLSIHLLPTRTDDVVTARALGIISQTILAGHSKSGDSLAYAVGLISSLLISISIWTARAVRAGKNCPPQPSTIAPTSPRVNLLEVVIAFVVAFGFFARIWNARAATLTAWSALSEEGEMLAWVDTVLRGGALSRDTFCLYGPLSVWLVATLLHFFGASLALWRYWIFALNAPALLAIYFLLRGLNRTRIAAALGAIVIGVMCIGPVPAMSWSLARVGFGVAAIASLHRALSFEKRGWFVATGLLAAAALLYSPEAGTSCAIAIAIVLIMHPRRWFGILWSAIGVALVALPATFYLIATHSLTATIDNMTLFSRVRLLGFGALVFPPFAFSLESLRAYFTPAMLVIAAFIVATKLLRGERDARVWTQTALVIFGIVLCNAAISRPDETHLAFVLPPVLILLCGLLEEAWFALAIPNHRVAATSALVAVATSLLPWSSNARENFGAFIEPPTGQSLSIARAGSALLPDEFARDLSELIREIQSRTAPNEPIWVFPNEALIYFLADRPQPTRFPLAAFAVTRAQRQQLIADLERTRPRLAIVYRDAPLHDRIPHEVALPEVVEYLTSNYELDHDVGKFALLRRKN